MDGSSTTINSNATFAQRQKNLLDQLDDVASTITGLQTEESMDVSESLATRTAHSSQTRHLRNKESIFKRPQNPKPKNFIRRMPDFKKNPHKWTRYSLDDVKAEDMTDTSNTKTAWSFMNELRNRKNQESDRAEEDGELPERIVFHRKTIDAPKKTDKDPKSSFKCSKVVMPEYVVGKGKTKKVKQNQSASGKSISSKQLKLDHLFEDDD